MFQSKPLVKLCDRLSQGSARLLNPQSYIIASHNSQLKDSVSIGLAAFPDKIYTDCHSVHRKHLHLISWQCVKKEEVKAFVFIVGNRYINSDSASFRSTDTLFHFSDACLYCTQSLIIGLKHIWSDGSRLYLIA